MKTAGLDIGTTGCKLTVFDESGSYLDRAYREYPARRTGSAHEVDADAILDMVWEVIGQMAGRYPDIGGIGVTSFGETFVAADGEGRALFPAMLYTDPRGAAERDALTERLCYVFDKNNRAEVEKLGRKARMRALKTHDAQTNYRRLLEIYHEIYLCV